MRRLIAAGTLIAIGCAGSEETHEHGSHEHGAHEHSAGGEHAAHEHAAHEHAAHDHHTGEASHDHASDAEEHAQLPEALRAFHDAFHPVWHGDESTRGVRACDKADELVTLSEAHRGWASETPPAGVDAVRYVAAAERLETESRSLKASCGADPSSVSAEAVSGVHDPLHELMHEMLEAEGGQHEGG